jgi:hypothetical protein
MGAVRALALIVSFLLLPLAVAEATPRPLTGKRAVVKRVSGKIKLKLAGAHKSVALKGTRAIPMGSTIDASAGKVKVVTTKGGGKLQDGTFSKGAFKITQTKGSSPLTDLTLTGGDFSACPATAAGRLVHASRKRAVRRLFGHAHGRFRSRGRHSSASVRGTKWDTIDTCAGTQTIDREGRVIAKSDGLTYPLDPGETVQILCDPDGQAPVSSLYCLAVLSEPAKNIFAFGIATESPDQASYDLCITDPHATTRHCDTYSFSEPDADGFRSAGVACVPGAGPGDYAVQWRIGGVDLAVPLPFTSTLPRDPSPFCTTG